MPQTSLVPVYGVIQNIAPAQDQCCTSMITLFTSNGIVRFALGPQTYVIDNVRLFPGMSVVAFYNPNDPVPLIFPPQYQAAIIGHRRQNENVAAGYFDQNLTMENQALQLNIGSSTDIITSNGQSYPCSPAGQYLVVFYGATTRSLPPQATPRRIIVFCQ